MSEAVDLPVSLYRLDREVLLAAPSAERNFFLAAAHAANELNLLRKLAIWTGNVRGELPIMHGQISQGLILLRILAGKLNESHELLQKSFYGAQLSKVYHSDLDADAKASLKEVSRYFGRENVLHHTRNLAFHYSAKDIGDALERLDPAADLYLYVAPRFTNTLYFFSEAIAAAAMLGEVSEETFTRFMDELVHISNSFIIFFDAFIYAFSQRHRVVVSKSNVEMPELPTFEDIQIPWFSVFGI
jgi:hypothetical protein